MAKQRASYIRERKIGIRAKKSESHIDKRMKISIIIIKE
jgi:hypothetical protein